MKVKGTTQVEVDIDLKPTVIELYTASVGYYTTLVSEDNKYYLQSSPPIDNTDPLAPRGATYRLTEIPQNKYNALVALRDLIQNFNYL